MRAPLREQLEGKVAGTKEEMATTNEEAAVLATTTTANAGASGLTQRPTRMGGGAVEAGGRTTGTTRGEPTTVNTTEVTTLVELKIFLTLARPQGVIPDTGATRTREDATTADT